ncbi:MAG: flagellar type III secretion system protein FlhB [Rhodocyclaceae bacterium]|nr:flagellar type III secretion system protein FlhB [Rhodocyclaceae bacterium]
MADSDLERTEPASSRRIEQAREEGRVPQSRELGGFLILLGGVAVLWSSSGWLSAHAKNLVRHGLSFGREAAFDEMLMTRTLASLSWEGLLLMAPIFLTTTLAAVAAPYLIGGWVFTTKPLTPDLSKLAPNISRVFSVRGLGEMVKAVLKAGLVFGVIVWLVRHHGDSLLAIMGQSLDVGIDSVFNLLFITALAMLLGMAVIVALDVPFQLWQYYKGLRMTKEEVRQEYKEMEGSPELKGRIRRTQREMARSRMMAEVPKADVVVTNPTHFSVALKYDAQTMSAPTIVAKGMNLVAQKIRDLATENQVPILEAPPLARALYRHAEIGEQVPAALYNAVAEVMAYVYQLNQFVAGQGLPPQAPTMLAVPDGMDPGSPDR